MQISRWATLLSILLLICGCNSNEHLKNGAASAPVHKQLSPDQNSFYQTLKSFCGQSFVGKSVFPENKDDSFYGKTLRATLSSCDDKEIRVPFSVGTDHSRTWIISKTENGLQLKHQHLHQDGTPDEISDYGGLANSNGTSNSQFFPADNFTQELIPAASTNVWNIALSDDKQYLTYYLERHNKPRFKAVLKRSDIKL